MPRELFSNAASTTLAAAIAANATSLTVASSTLFPAPVLGASQFRVLIDAELFLVSNVSGTTWTVAGAQEGTVAAAHAQGATVTHIVTAGALGALGPLTLPINRYVMITLDGNNTSTMVKGTEYSFPYIIPGPGLIADFTWMLNTTSSDTGTVVRFGVRADNAGLPGAVLVEAAIPADTTSGTGGYKSLAASLPCGATYWVSLCCQGSGTVLPSLRTSSSQLTTPFFGAGYGGSRPALDWAAGHGPVAATAANASSTLAAGPVPLPMTTNAPYLPVIVIRRAS